MTASEPVACMKKFESILTHILEGVVVACLLAISVIVVTLVVLRYGFNSSITGANEIITVLFVYTTSIGAAVAVGRREHIAITFAVERLSPGIRKVIDAAGLWLVALINGVMLWASVDWMGATGNYLMPSTGLPRAVAQLSVPLGCGLALLYCVLRIRSGLAPEDELECLPVADE